MGSARDAGTLAQLHAGAIGDAWPEAAFASLLSRAEVFVILGARAGFSIAEGFILIRLAADEAEVLTFCVAEGVRRVGLGAALIETACDLALSRGGVQMFLEVSQDNPGAFALYQKSGFAVVGRRAAYYRQGSLAADAFVMRKALSTVRAPANEGGASSFRNAPESTKSE
jgi:ribosomal-protein-alanine N-acetyltransferase